MKITIHSVKFLNGAEQITFTSERNTIGITKLFPISKTSAERLQTLYNYIERNFPIIEDIKLGEQTYVKEVIPEPTPTEPIKKTAEELEKEADQKAIDDLSQEITNLSTQIKDLIVSLKEDKEVVEIATLTDNVISKKSERVASKFTEYNVKYESLQTKKIQLKTLQEQFKLDYPMV